MKRDDGLNDGVDNGRATSGGAFTMSGLLGGAASKTCQSAV